MRCDFSLGRRFKFSVSRTTFHTQKTFHPIIFPSLPHMPHSTLFSKYLTQHSTLTSLSNKSLITTFHYITHASRSIIMYLIYHHECVPFHSHTHPILTFTTHTTSNVSAHTFLHPLKMLYDTLAIHQLLGQEPCCCQHCQTTIL